MREFFPGISPEICMFFRVPEEISGEIGKTGNGVIISLRELKSKASAGKADTRSPRLRSTFPGAWTGKRTSEAVSHARHCCHVINMCSITFKY
jgi:hypothetical protein